MSSTPPPVHVPAGDDSHLRRGVLGTGSIVFMVVAAAGPLTVLAGIGPLAIAIGGVSAPVAYLFSGFAMVMFAVAFTRMSRHVGAVGAFYAYVTKGLGKDWGLAAALLALMSYNTLQVGVYGLLAVQTKATLLDLFGVDVPWWLIAVVAIGLVYLVGWAGIDVGAKVLGCLLVAETAVLLLLAFSVLAQGGAGSVDASSFSPSNIFSPGMGAALAFAFVAYTGFESTAIYRREARDPERSIPRATYIAIIGMAASYAFILWAVIQAFGSAQVQAAAAQNPPALFFTAMTQYVGPWASTVMSVLIVTSVYAAQLAFHNTINRYAFALAKEGLLPGLFAATHPRRRSPYRAGQVQSVLALVVVVGFAVAGADPYTQLLLWVNTPGAQGITVLMLLTAVASVVYFTRRNPAAGTRGTVVAGVVGTLLLGVGFYVSIDNIALLTGTGTVANSILTAITPLTVVAGLLYARWLRRHRPEVYAQIGEARDEEPVPAAVPSPASDPAPSPAPSAEPGTVPTA